MALAPRSSQTPAGIAKAERPTVHSASTKLAKRAARSSIAPVLWIGSGRLRKRAGELVFRDCPGVRVGLDWLAGSELSMVTSATP